MTPFERRTRSCQARLRNGAGDALVLSPSSNLYYLTGHREAPGERHFLAFVPTDGEPTLVVPELSSDQVRDAIWFDDVRTWTDETGPDEVLRSVVADHALSAGHLLVDDTMWARFTHDLSGRLPDASFGLASDVLTPLRRRKDDTELRALRRAATVADDVVEAVRARGGDVVGSTETELARFIESELTTRGGDGVAFETIVASGPNGAKPHHSHTDREIRSGDPVVLDFGTRVDAYPSDQTRTLVFGEDPPSGFVEVHEVVRAAQRAGLDAIEPGVSAESVDAAARSVVESAGYGDRFVHRTGHGVGLDVHEPPFVVAGNSDSLAPGTVFSVEPGVYLPGEFGVRIEDLVVVTENGYERLNTTGRGWRTDVGDSR